MDLTRRTLQSVVVAMAVMGLMATSAQADIVHFEDYQLGSPLGDPDNELAFVRDETGVSDLDLFQKHDPSETPVDQLFTSESVNVTESFGNLWHVDWTTVDWDIRYVLVKDGAFQGDQIYTLWRVTADQFKSGGGDVSLHNFPAKDISHITVFGVNDPAVAEPTTLLVFGAGILGLMALGRRLR